MGMKSFAIFFILSLLFVGCAETREEVLAEDSHHKIEDQNTHVETEKLEYDREIAEFYIKEAEVVM